MQGWQQPIKESFLLSSASEGNLRAQLDVSAYSRGISNDTLHYSHLVCNIISNGSAVKPGLFFHKVTEVLKEHRVLQGTGKVIMVIMFTMYCSPRSV